MPTPTRHRRAFAAVTAALVVLPLFVAAGAAVDAQTAVADEAELRTAVAAGGVVELAADIELTCGDGALSVTEDLTLRSASGTVYSLSIDSGCDRLIEVSGGASLTVESLHLTGGRAHEGANGDFDGGDGNGAAGGNGGAIVSDGDITISNARFSDNRAGDGGLGDTGDNGESAGDSGENGGDGGHGGSGGAIYTTGSVTATATSFTNNRAGNGGRSGDGGNGQQGAAGVAEETGGAGGHGGTGGTAGSGGHGGAIAASGTVSLDRSTLDGNSAGSGGIGGNGGNGGNGGPEGDGSGGGQGGNAGAGGNGGDAGSGGAVQAGSATVTSSTVHGNSISAAGTGGTAGALGGPGSGTPEGGTGQGASDGDAGAPGSGGALSTAAAMSLTASTVTANSATDGDAARSLDAGGDLTLDHTIASGTDPGDDCQAVGTVTASESVAGDATCAGATEIAENDLGLGALDPNGGPTQTRVPSSASDLLDAGAETCPTTTDQRGVQRPQGSACDIGSVERRGTFLASVLGTAAEPTVAVGATAQVSFTVTVDDTSTGVLAASEMVPTIVGCGTNPIRSGATEPFAAGDVIIWTCDVTSNEVGVAAVTFEATVANGEDGAVLPLTTSAEVSFAQVTTTTGVDTTTTQVTDPPVIDDSGSAGNGVLPTTGLSIFLTLLAAATLLFGGGGLTRYAKTRVATSRWGLERGVPVPIGTHRSRPADRQLD